jgi:malate dehydrogenase (oxaloacetate-decarboxylating)
VGEERINPTVIVPSVFDARVAPAVAAAVRAAAKGEQAPAVGSEPPVGTEPPPPPVAVNP